MNWGIDPTLIGPYTLPWHALLALLDVASLVFLLYSWRKHGQLNSEHWMWPVLAIGAHVFYALRLAEERPTFELEIRYYGLFFAIGLLGGARAMPIYFQQWGFPRKDGEGLTLWTPIGMLLGAHLVHLVFYEWEAFVNDPIRIFQLGSGLASHGGGLGAIVAVIWYCGRQGINPLRYMDPAMAAATWVIPWVRVGNFFNSEIVGTRWDGPWSVAFLRYCEVVDGRYVCDCPGYPAAMCAEPVTRHPSQVYEALLGFVMVGLAIYLQRTWRNRLRPGAIIFILLAYYFTTRFLVEYVKEYEPVADWLPITMGQALSLPIVLGSLYMLIFSKTSNIRSVIAGPEVVDNPPLWNGPGGAATVEPAAPKAKRRPRAEADRAEADRAEADVTPETRAAEGGAGDDVDPPVKTGKRPKKKRKKS